jgi:hypothetical protein
MKQAEQVFEFDFCQLVIFPIEFQDLQNFNIVAFIELHQLRSVLIYVWYNRLSVDHNYCVLLFSFIMTEFDRTYC